MMETWTVNAAGIALMGFIAWWFWLSRPAGARATGQQVIDITVADGVYEPGWIEIKKGESVTLRFHREDPSPCAEQVIFHGLGISEQLPVGRPKTIRVTPKAPGTYRFTCQMQMYQGKLTVTE